MALNCTHGPDSHNGPCPASANERARAWLLIEHPGPWAARLEDTALPAPVARAVTRAREHAVRAQLIRRPGRRRAVPPVQVYTAWSGAQARSGAGAWLEGRELADLADLDSIDLAAVAAGHRPGFGTPEPDLVLVCTNGKHNACCARLGAPLARALRQEFGDAVWETTHLGGDRYSANMVCLPDGLYYGDLAVADGLAAAAAYFRGEVWLDRYRGRAGLPRAAQAAEHALRARSGDGSVTGVRIESVREAAGGETEVVAGLGGQRYLARVACGADGDCVLTELHRC
jgi:hypothetical protein